MQDFKITLNNRDWQSCYFTFFLYKLDSNSREGQLMNMIFVLKIDNRRAKFAATAVTKNDKKKSDSVIQGNIILPLDKEEQIQIMTLVII